MRNGQKMKERKRKEQRKNKGKKEWGRNEEEEEKYTKTAYEERMRTNEWECKNEEQMCNEYTKEDQRYEENQKRNH